MTLRDAMASGQRGGFAKWLYQCYQFGIQIDTIMDVYTYANSENRAALERTAPEFRKAFEAWQFLNNWRPPLKADLEREFSGLTKLDDPAADPFQNPIRTPNSS